MSTRPSVIRVAGRDWSVVTADLSDIQAVGLSDPATHTITLHPRTRMQFFSGQADWSMIKAVKEQARIPVIGSGDIHCARDAERMMATTGCVLAATVPIMICWPLLPGQTTLCCACAICPARWLLPAMGHYGRKRCCAPPAR